MGQNSHVGDISPKTDYGIIHIYGSKFESYSPSLKLEQSLQIYTVAVRHDVYKHVT